MDEHLKHTRESRKRRAKVARLGRALPEVEISGEQHLAFKIGKKTFAHYLFDHQGDGLIALASRCKAPRGVQRELTERDPERYFVPRYGGPKGWVGLRLDLAEVDWDEVNALLRTAYRLNAPKRLAFLAV